VSLWDEVKAGFEMSKLQSLCGCGAIMFGDEIKCLSVRILVIDLNKMN
jgi:hypothetical protein